MRALFGRKILNLKELKELTKEAIEDGVKGTAYEVTKEIELSDEEFKEFAKDFCKDQHWITKEDGGCNEKGELKFKNKEKYFSRLGRPHVSKIYSNRKK